MRGLPQHILNQSELIPSPDDQRDYTLYTMGVAVESSNPSKAWLPEPSFVLHQMNTPMCAAACSCNAKNGHYEHRGRLPQKDQHKGFSMRYLYSRAKELDGIPNLPGTYLRTINNILTDEGVAPEHIVPFIDDSQPIRTTIQQRHAASPYRIASYARLHGVHQIKKAIYSGQYVTIGTSITERNWQMPTHGFLGRPAGNLEGYHATMIYGYVDSVTHGGFTGYFRCMNSWGPRWGDQGRFWLPYEYLSFTAQEFGFLPFVEAWALGMQHPSRAIANVRLVQLYIDKPQARVNHVVVPIDPHNRRVTAFVNHQWGRTMLPIRFVAEAMGAKVDWFQEQKQMITIDHQDQHMRMWIGNPTARVNGKSVAIDPDNSAVAPYIVPKWERAVLPVRFIAEQLGAKVHWNEREKLVTLEFNV